MDNLVVFTMEGCPFCVEMKDKIKELGIEFVDADIEENEMEYEIFKKLVGNDYVPAFMIIMGEDDAKVFAPERDYNEIDEGIDIIKKHFNL
jgi:glutaredoxin